MAKYIYGIDLGTTYSCISYVDETGRAVVVDNLEGTNTTPSVVNFANPTTVVVGQIAKETAVIDPKNTVSLVKTMMGKTNFAINYNGEDKTPEEVSAYILRKLAEDASKLLDTEVKDVVITCPAYFGTEERTATHNAGEIAGLNVLAVINEPTAAALYYGCAKEQNDKTILVYDLGGGTFDVTIMRIGEGKITVICSDGNHELGGKDWDNALMNHLAEQFCSAVGYDGELDEYAQQDLRIKAEKAKQQLSSRPKVPVMLEAAGLRARVEVTRETFDELTAALLKESLDKTDAAIAEAAKKGYSIDEILLVGGSTRMPQVQEALKEKYGLEPKFLEPDEAVAKGAAIYALGVYEQLPNPNFDSDKDDDSKEEKEKPSASTDMISGLGGKKIYEVVTVATTKSYALKVIRGGKEECCNMIIKNVPMPDGSVSVTRTFGTFEANQESAELVVYENDFLEEYFAVDEFYRLGTATLKLPGNLPAGAPIQVSFALDKEGILLVTGLDVTSNEKITAEMKASAGTTMSKQDIEAAKEKAKSVVVE